MKFIFNILLASLLIAVSGCSSDEWISLFDGESLNGWTANENPESWIVDDGAIVTAGPRSHLFYTGACNGPQFQKF